MSETEFTELVQSFFSLIERLQESAQALKGNGGDVKDAFLAAFPEELRPQMAMQYPMISMMLGV